MSELPVKSEPISEFDRLRQEITDLINSGIVEVAARNPNVLEYMRHWEGRAETAEAALAASDARIAELEAEVERLRAAPKVKPLEWEEIYDDALAGGVVAHAETVFGTYRAWGTGSWSAPSGKHGKHDGNLDKAKVSAQADYEARILSALVQP